MLDLEIHRELKGFSLDVRLSLGDELVSIFGPSGSGKSLTLQCIAGLLKPDAGRIAINGRSVFDSSRSINLRPQERRVGYLFQNYALFPHMSVQENIGYGLFGLPREDRERRVAKMIDTMRLEGLGRRRPAELSGGQQQRVALARVLVTEPQLLLLDEPFSALDSPIRGRLHAELLDLLRQFPITTILVTHDLSEAYTLCQKMVVYDAGRLLQVGSRDEVLRRPATRKVARFTGTKNLFRGVVEEVAPDRLRVRVGRLTLVTRPGQYSEGDRVDLCLRPEEVMLIRPGLSVGTAVEENWCQAEVVGEVAHGTSYTLLLRLDGDPLGVGRDYDLQAEIPAHVYYRLGVDGQKRWTLSLKRDEIHIIGPSES